jgi:hypothetical protein
MGQVKVRVEGLPTDVAQVIRTLRDAYAVVNQTDPQKLTGTGNKTVVYQYIMVRVQSHTAPTIPRDDRR